MEIAFEQIILEYDTRERCLLSAAEPITMDPEAAGLAALAAGGMDLRAQTRMQGLGALDALPDHLLVHILSFLPAKQLCVVSCVSAAMHVFAAVFPRPATQEEAP